jgi:hypothetical protein
VQFWRFLGNIHKGISPFAILHYQPHHDKMNEQLATRRKQPYPDHALQKETRDARNRCQPHNPLHQNHQIDNTHFFIFNSQTTAPDNKCVI